MTLLGLMVGDLIAKASSEVADTLINKQKLNLSPSLFTDMLDGFGQSGDKLQLQDLNLDKEEEAKIMEIRDLSLNKGLKHLEIEIHGIKYDLDTKKLELTPVLS
jgi:hypothetical protein